MKTIPLTKGKLAIVDDTDYDWLMQWKWCCLNQRYAMRRATDINGKSTYILMHRVIIGTPDGMETDHINGNGLDNRRSNLRTCTHAENTRNHTKHKDNSCGFKGVDWRKDLKKFRSRISINKKNKHIGNFDSASQAYAAYCEYATLHHGQFAKF